MTINVDRRGELYSGVSNSSDTITPLRYRLAVLLPDGDEQTEDGRPEFEQLIETAEAIAGKYNGEILLLTVVTVPGQTPLDLARKNQSIQKKGEKFDSWRRLTSDRINVPVRGIFCLAHRETQAVCDQLTKNNCDALLLGMGRQSSQRLRLFRGSEYEKLFEHAPCDVFVHCGTESPIQAQQILLSVSSGPHLGLSVETARVLAHAAGASVDVVHVVPPTASDDEQSVASEILDATSQILDNVEAVELNVLEAESVPETIVEQSTAYDVTVLGAPTKSLLERQIFGSISEAIRQKSMSTTLLAKQYTGKTSGFARWLFGDVETSSMNQFRRYSAE